MTESKTSGNGRGAAARRAIEDGGRQGANVLRYRPLYSVEPDGESEGLCADCGNWTKTIWGFIDQGDDTVASYFLHWTVEKSEPAPRLDLIFGAWGEGTGPERRCLAVLHFMPDDDDGWLVISEPGHRSDEMRELCANAVTPADVLGTPLATDLHGYAQAILSQDPRAAALHDLGKVDKRWVRWEGGERLSLPWKVRTCSCAKGPAFLGRLRRDDPAPRAAT